MSESTDSSTDQRSSFHLFKTFWPAILGWGCLFAAVVVADRSNLRLFVDAGFLWLVSAPVSFIGTWIAGRLYPPALRGRSELVNLTPLLGFLVLFYFFLFAW